MEPTDEQDVVFPSQGDGEEAENIDREQLEGLASLRWQREESSRMSHRETGCRTLMPTPYRVIALQKAAVGQGGDSDNEGGNTNDATQHTRKVAEEERPALQIDA